MQYYHSKEHQLELVKSENLNKNFELHNHARHYVISYVTRGSVEVILNGILHLYQAGEAFLVMPFEPHSVQVEENTQLVSLCMGKVFLEENTREETARVIEEFLTDAMEKGIITVEARESIFEKLIKLWERSAERNETIDKEMKKAVGKTMEDLTQRLIDFPEEELTIDEMAQESALSKYHMIRKFKQDIGLTPHQFQVQRRIRKAQDMLRDGHSIVEVSLEMGFYDQSHFSRYFQKIVGISPMEYIASETKMG